MGGLTSEASHSTVQFDRSPYVQYLLKLLHFLMNPITPNEIHNKSGNIVETRSIPHIAHIPLLSSLVRRRIRTHPVEQLIIRLQPDEKSSPTTPSSNLRCVNQNYVARTCAGFFDRSSTPTNLNEMKTKMKSKKLSTMRYRILRTCLIKCQIGL
jgi:hypothetical protein